MVGVGPIVGVDPPVTVEVGLGVDENVAVMGTSAPLRRPSCNVAAMMVAAWSSTEMGWAIPGMLQASILMIRRMGMRNVRV